RPSSRPGRANRMSPRPSRQHDASDASVGEARRRGNDGERRPIVVATLVPQIRHLLSRFPSRGEAKEEALAAFQQKDPTYASTRYRDELRAREYARLDRQRHVYLDYTGGGLYAESQLQAHLAILISNVFGNPHSTNPASQATTDLVEHTRRYVLEY